MASKMALGRRIVADFHDDAAADEAEAEWRRVHQEQQAPTDMATVDLAPGRYKARELLARPGLAASKSEAERLLRQRAVQARRRRCSRRGPRSRSAPGETFVLSIGAQRFVRFDRWPRLDRRGGLPVAFPFCRERGSGVVGRRVPPEFGPPGRQKIPARQAGRSFGRVVLDTACRTSIFWSSSPNDGVAL